MRPPGRAVRADSSALRKPARQHGQAPRPGSSGGSERTGGHTGGSRLVPSKSEPSRPRRGPGERHAQPVSAQDQGTPTPSRTGMYGGEPAASSQIQSGPASTAR